MLISKNTIPHVNLSWKGIEVGMKIPVVSTIPTSRLMNETEYPRYFVIVVDFITVLLTSFDSIHHFVIIGIGA